MTADQAADIIGVTENRIRAMAREGIIRRPRRGEYNGQDVQRLLRLRTKHGVAEGTAMARDRANIGGDHHGR